MRVTAAEGEAAAANRRVDQLRREFVAATKASSDHRRLWEGLPQSAVTKVDVAAWWGDAWGDAIACTPVEGFDGAHGCAEDDVQAWCTSALSAVVPDGMALCDTHASAPGLEGQRADAFKVLGLAASKHTLLAPVEAKRPRGEHDGEPASLDACVVGKGQVYDRLVHMCLWQPGRRVAEGCLLDGRHVSFMRLRVHDGRERLFAGTVEWSAQVGLDDGNVVGRRLLTAFMCRAPSAHGFRSALRLDWGGRCYEADLQPLGSGYSSVVCKLLPCRGGSGRLIDVAGVPAAATSAAADVVRRTTPLVAKVYRAGAEVDADHEFAALAAVAGVRGVPLLLGRVDWDGVPVVVTAPAGVPLKVGALKKRVYFDVAEAVLRTLHGRGFIHGDVKRGNMYTYRGALFLNDYAAARRMPEGRAGVDVGVGTHPHRSPHVLETGEVRPRDDLYALLVALWLDSDNAAYDKPVLGGGSEAATARDWLSSMPAVWRAAFATVTGDDDSGFGAAVAPLLVDD